MSAVHERVLISAQNLYNGALEAFEPGRYWLAESTAGASIGGAAFLMFDPETPPEIKVRAEILFKQAKALADQTRKAWIRRETEGRLSGPRSVRREIDAGDYIADIVRLSIAE